MRSRRFAAAALVAALLVNVSGRSAFAGAWSLAPGEWYADLGGSFNSSATYHDADGNRMDLAAPGLLERRTGTARVEMGWKKRLSVQMSAPFVSLTRTHADGSFDQTATGLGDFGFGLRWALQNGPGATALQFGWSAPLGYNRAVVPGPGTGLTGDPAGLQAFTAALQCGTPLGARGFVEASGGYEYRFLTAGGRKKEAGDKPEIANRTWADHVVLTGAMAMWMTDRLQVSGLYDGRLPVDQGDRYPEVTSHLVGPRLTYHVDDKIAVYGGSWHTASAKNALHANEFYCGLAFRQSKLKRNQGFLGGSAR